MWGILKAAGLALAVANLKQRLRAVAIKSILAAAGFLILVIAFCFLLVALHLWLSAVLNPIASAAIIGGALLIVAAILLYLASRPARAVSPVAPPAAAKGADTDWSQIARGFASGRTPLASPVFQAAVLALIAGFFLGRRRPEKDDSDD